MKVITVIQPWAMLIALKEKGLETRSWPTKYRGPLGIHAGKKIDREACEREPIKSTLAAHGYTADNLPTGVILATSTLADCYQTKSYGLSDYVAIFNGDNIKSIDGKEFAFGDYSSGRYAWELVDVSQLAEPIPAKGQLGLWNFDITGMES